MPVFNPAELINYALYGNLSFFTVYFMFGIFLLQWQWSQRIKILLLQLQRKLAHAHIKLNVFNNTQYESRPIYTVYGTFYMANTF